MSKFWHALEAIPGPSAVRAEWQSWIGGEFGVLQAAFLRGKEELAGSHPCREGCGCYHKAIHHGGGRIVAVCQCDPWNCDDFPLTDADLIPYELNWSRLGRAVAKAFGCDFKLTEMGMHGVRQIATFSGMALPVFLVVQSEPDRFRGALAHLSVGARQSFVVLAPTGQWMDARGHALLAACKAGFFDLESHLSILPNGELASPKAGGQLFSRFLPEQAAPMRENEAERIFGLLTKLRAKPGTRKAHPATIFELTVLQGLSQKETASRCRPRCAPSLVTRRVQDIEREFGLTIEKLRDYASDILERDSAVKADRVRKPKHGGPKGVEVVEADDASEREEDPDDG